MIAPALARRKDLVRLQRRQDALTKRVTELEARADAAVAGLIQGVSDVEQRARALVPAQLQQGRQLLQQVESVQQLTLQTQIRGVTSVVNTLQATAYGDKGTLLSTNNLLLAISQLFWTALDPLLQATGAVTPQTATIIAALAPVGTLVTGEILVGSRQDQQRSQPRERFVSGRTTVSVPGKSSESLEGKIDAAYWPTFSTLSNVQVTATIVEPSGITNAAVSANVNGGFLEIAVLPIVTGGTFVTLSFVRTAAPLRNVTVAWTVDTGGGGV
jgi:hypothetical protein